MCEFAYLGMCSLTSTARRLTAPSKPAILMSHQNAFMLCAQELKPSSKIRDSNAQAEVNVTRFNVNASAKSGNQITLKLDTDAPNELRLYVMIYRTYKSLDEFTKKPSEEYLAYTETDVSVAELKQGVSYLLNHDEWKKEFADRQQQSTAAGIKPLAKTVSKAVTVSVGLAKNEAMLGTGNGKLAGSAVKKQVWGDKTLKSEQQLAVSLSVAPKQAASLNPTNLDVGKWYMTAQQDVPLMPHYNPPNKMAALAQVKKLPVGTPFKILQRKVVNDEIWYSVSADFNAFDLTGWINSQAISAPGAIGSR